MLSSRPIVSVLAAAFAVLTAGSTIIGCGKSVRLEGSRLAPEPCTKQSYDPAEIFKRSSKSVAVVMTDSSQGSGFVVKQDKRFTYVLTNSHVVNGEDDVMLKWSNGRTEKGEVIGDFGGSNLQKDVALVRIDAIRGEPLRLRETLPPIGSEVVVIGAPQGLDFSLSRGVLSQIRENGDFIQIDAAINPGNSGGPLFDETGCILGVVTFKKADSEALNFAIGYKPIRHFLDNPAIERPNRPAKSSVAKPKKIKIYEPTLHVLPASLGFPTPSGAGWSLSSGHCFSNGKKERCLNEYDIYSSKEDVYRLLSTGLDGVVDKIGVYWIRYNGRRGGYAHHEVAYTSRTFASDGPSDNIRDWRIRTVIDCEQWLAGDLEDMQLKPIVPNSYQEHHAKESCMKGTEVAIESNSRPELQPPSDQVRASGTIDERTDQIFWEKNPSLRGQKLPADSPFKQQWMNIREALLNEQADEILWIRYPQFRGLKLPPNGPLAREWLEIRRGLDP